MIQDDSGLLKPAHRSTLHSCVSAFLPAAGRCKHTQVAFLWIMQRFRTIAAFPINLERLDASVFTSMLPEIRCRSRTYATRATDVFLECKHCSRRRRCVKAQTKRRQSHVNAGTVPSTRNAGTQGRPVAGLREKTLVVQPTSLCSCHLSCTVMTNGITDELPNLKKVCN